MSSLVSLTAGLLSSDVMTVHKTVYTTNCRTSGNFTTRARFVWDSPYSTSEDWTYPGDSDWLLLSECFP
jgi:hypothetical protein